EVRQVDLSVDDQLFGGDSAARRPRCAGSKLNLSGDARKRVVRREIAREWQSSQISSSDKVAAVLCGSPALLRHRLVGEIGRVTEPKQGDEAAINCRKCVDLRDRNEEIENSGPIEDKQQQGEHKLLYLARIDVVGIVGIAAHDVQPP